ncbi:MAG: phage tail tape measure protein [Eggerthellaceae bacterium]|nr:phage tail tape measure protein [Eggerthellaceae bacterium]
MAGVYKGLTIKIEADDGDLQRALNRNGKQAGTLSRELKQIEKSLRFDTRSPQLLAQKMQKVSQQAENTRDRLKLLKQAERELGREKMSGQQWSELQGDIAACEARLRAYREQLRELGAQQAASNSVLGKAGALLQQHAGGFEKAGAAMRAVGGVMTRTVTPAIAVGAAASVKAAVDIDTSLTNVRKTVDGTEEDYARLKDAAVEFSKTNAVSAAQILDIESLGAQLGFTLDTMANGKSEIQEFGEVVSGLDIATNMSAEQAGTELAQFFNIMGEGKDMASNYGSAIVELGNSFATTESDVSAMAMRIAGAGKSIGLSSADVLGLATALSSLGIEAEAGGTAVSTVMSQIDKDVATGGEGLQTWASTARMSVDEFVAAWKDRPVDALDSVLRGMESAVEEGGNLSVMLEDLGISSLRQTDMMKRLANSGDLMSRAVGAANDAWRENTALSAEVENRNDSLAARFEMLKNRIVAVAQEVGEPIADAMLSAVEAARPLFDAIESGARSFSEMSAGEQQAVLQTLAFATALGPALSGIGGIVSKIGPLGEGMESIAKGLAKADMKVFGTAAAEASVASGAAATGGIALLVAALAGAAIGIANTAKEAADYRDATTGLVEAAEGVSRSMSGQADAFGDAAGASESSRDRVKKALEDQAETARKLNDDMAKVGSDSAMLKAYADKIGELAGKCDGDARKIAELQLAVDGYNRITGESVAITDGASGAIDRSTGALMANADAWIANARAQAMQEAMVDLQRQQVENTMAQADAKDALSDAEQRLADVQSDPAATVDAELAATMAVQARREEYNQATEAVAANEQAMARLTDAFAEQSQQAEQASAHAAELQGGYDRLRAGMEEAGVSAEDAAARIAQLDAQGIDPKQFHVTDDGTIVDNMGRVIELDAKTLGGKPYTVTDNGTIALAESNLARLDGNNPDDKRFSVEAITAAANAAIDATNRKPINDKPFTARANTAAANAAVDNINRKPVNDKSFTIRAFDHASGVISNVLGMLRSVTDRTSTITTVHRNVTVAEARNAAGGVAMPAHMAGAIVTRATVTDMGLVGEAGAEAVLQGAHGTRAIVPLTNRRYVRPFAQAVASEMPAPAAQGRGDVNVYLDYRAGEDATRLVRDIARQVKMHRMAG